MKVAKWCVTMLCLVVLPVQAAGLNTTAVEAYLETLPEVRVLADEMHAQGHGDFFEPEITPGMGTFDPHVRGVTALEREHASMHARLGTIVRDKGFTSAQSWAETGDRIIITYGAVKVEAESPELLALAQSGSTMDPAMLQLLNPEMRMQMEMAMMAAKALAQVSEADKQLIRPYIARLDQAFEQ